MPNKTKIICTIGPSCNTRECLIEMIQAGMNVARLNFSHGTYEEHLQTINLLKEARKKLGVPLSIMLDTKGPEVRIGKIANGSVELVKGERWLLLKEEIEGDKEKVTVKPGKVLDCVKPGDTILFDDGFVSSIVTKKNDREVEVEFENGGILKSGKGVNIPNVSLNLPAITEKDKEDIHFGCLHDVDIIAASFVRCPDHIVEIQKLLEKGGGGNIKVIAKIENAEGIQNFGAIAQVSDGVMIARGDLGVEVPISKVPSLQKMMIRQSFLAGKASVTATQMLESMIVNPRPTRAEVSDVANAIYDGTSAVMLSGETAIGKYPVEVVKVMSSIIEAAEADIDYSVFFEHHSGIIYNDVPSAVTLATVKTSYSCNAKAIFAFTSSGATARLISRLRPSMPIIAITPEEKSYHCLALNWGVIPFLGMQSHKLSIAFTEASQFALEKGYLCYGDLVLVTAGSTFGVSKTTNMMIVESIGDVLIRGDSGKGHPVHGNIAIVLSSESCKPYSIHNYLVVLTKCDESYRTIIADCLGVILENQIHDKDSERNLEQIACELGKPYIIRADDARRILKNEQLVTMDPEKALVYKGVMIYET